MKTEHRERLKNRTFFQEQITKYSNEIYQKLRFEPYKKNLTSYLVLDLLSSPTKS